MKIRMASGICLAGLLGTAAFAAAGQESVAPDPPESPPAAAEVIQSDAAESARPRTGARCMRETGSNIRSKSCRNARGQALDRERQAATGRDEPGTQVQVGEASSRIYNRLNDG
ncbi:hypothetical protein FKV24_007455 [Lysobacter maris]|uniref:Secreted protein n=2 Tax=Marilutibacter maris TaxID=1605891 RepID=A0A508B0C0_9GAMM|nr:hypothetical protein FKV24_007455 [Lysobacter maris]